MMLWLNVLFHAISSWFNLSRPDPFRFLWTRPAFDGEAPSHPVNPLRGMANLPVREATAMPFAAPSWDSNPLLNALLSLAVGQSTRSVPWDAKDFRPRGSTLP